MLTREKLLLNRTVTFEPGMEGVNPRDLFFGFATPSTLRVFRRSPWLEDGTGPAGGEIKPLGVIFATFNTKRRREHQDRVVKALTDFCAEGIYAAGDYWDETLDRGATRIVLGHWPARPTDDVEFASEGMNDARGWKIAVDYAEHLVRLLVEAPTASLWIGVHGLNLGVSHRIPGFDLRIGPMADMQVLGVVSGQRSDLALEASTDIAATVRKDGLLGVLVQSFLKHLQTNRQYPSKDEKLTLIIDVQSPSVRHLVSHEIAHPHESLPSIEASKIEKQFEDHFREMLYDVLKAAMTEVLQRKALEEAEALTPKIIMGTK